MAQMSYVSQMAYMSKVSKCPMLKLTSNDHFEFQ